MSKVLKVLHVSTWNVRCGIATYCANLVKSLDALGLENDVFALEPHLWSHYVPADVDRLIKALVAKAKCFDLVHIQHEHGLFGAALGMKYSEKQYHKVLAALNEAKVPVITTFHTEVAPTEHSKLGLIKRFKEKIRYYNWNTRIGAFYGTKPGMSRAIVHSQQTRYSLIKAGLPENAVHVLRHACLASRQDSIDRDMARSRLGFETDDVVLTMFGFVGAYKGHDFAVEALKELPENFRLAICGGSHPESRDGFLDELLRKIKFHDLSDRVTLTGWISPDVAELYYAATDLCLAPYRVSNLSSSGAITWALSSGRPVIASRINAFQDIQREADCLFTFTPEATSELAWAITTLWNDPKNQERLVESAKRYVEKFSWPRIAASTLELYESMAGEHANSRIQLYKTA